MLPLGKDTKGYRVMVISRKTQNIYLNIFLVPFLVFLILSQIRQLSIFKLHSKNLLEKVNNIEYFYSCKM